MYVIMVFTILHVAFVTNFAKDVQVGSEFRNGNNTFTKREITELKCIETAFTHMGVLFYSKENE